jgi:hypothetical protein
MDPPFRGSSADVSTTTSLDPILKGTGLGYEPLP